LKLSALFSLKQALARPESLPERYWRFFLPALLQDEGLLIGREDELDRLDKVFKRWQEGHPTSVALIGPQGCGKSTRIIDWAEDGCFLTFETLSAGVTFALHLQEVHHKEPDLPKVYTGINMGEVTEHPGPAGKDGPPRVEGLAVDTAARIQSLALPGQILMSSAVFNSTRQRLSSAQMDAPICWEAHGPYLFKDFDEVISIGEVGIEGAAPFEPPPGNKKVQRAVTTLEEDTLGWRPAAGLSIPGRPEWIFSAHLGTGGFGEIWLAADKNTHAQHVFKFCFQADRIRGH